MRGLRKGADMRRPPALIKIYAGTVGRTHRAAAALICAALLPLLLTACQGKARTGPNGELLVRGTFNDDFTAVIGDEQEWTEQAGKEDAAEEWQKNQTYPLDKDAQLLYYPEYPLKRTCALNPVTIEYSIRQSQFGRNMELTLNEAGEVARLVLRGSVDLDLGAPGLDFTGFTGEVYADKASVTLDSGRTVDFDPCPAYGDDKDHTHYTLPVTVDADIPPAFYDAINPSSLSGDAGPALCILTLEEGQVSAVCEVQNNST